MTNRRTGTILLILFLITLQGWAQDDRYRLNLDFGYRWQPLLAGSRDLYRSQLDLGEGPKLFAGHFLYAAPPGTHPLFDRLELRMNGWGGEPYNMAQLRAARSDLYELRFDYRNSVYFNSLPSFANPLFTQGELLSQSRYDTRRSSMGLEFRLWPGRQVSPFVGLEQNSQEGDWRTSLSEGQDEFRIDGALDTDSTDLRFGANFKLTRFSLRLEQSFRWYGDETELSAGPQPGNSQRTFLGQDIFLENYTGRRDVDATIPFSSAAAVYQPVDSLSLRAQVSYSMADLDSNLTDSSLGGFFSFPLSGFYGERETGNLGQAKQPSLLADISAQWDVHPRVRILERAFFRRLHVAGGLGVSSRFQDLDLLLRPSNPAELRTSTLTSTFFSTDTDSQEIEASIFLTPHLTARAGHRYERKELKLEEDRFRWDRNVLLLGLSYQATRRNRVHLDYELGRTNQSILRLDPLDFHRLKLRGSVAVLPSLGLSGSLYLFDHQNDLEGVNLTSNSRGYSVEVDYSPMETVSLFAQYERRDVDSDILLVVPQTLSAQPSLYREQADYGHLLLNFRLPRNLAVTLGYSIWGSVGDFPLNYHQPHLRVEYPLGERLVTYVRWSYYDYNEKVPLFPQDYRTHLLALGFRISLSH